MLYYSPAVDYHTPTRSGKQAHSYSTHPPYSQQQYDGNSGRLSNDQNSQDPSLRLLPKISGNLFSLISRFEALDCLSTPSKSPSLHLPSSKYPRDSERSRTVTIEPQTRRLSTIFSPSRISRIIKGEPLSLDGLILSGDAEDDVFISPGNKIEESSKNIGPGISRLANGRQKVGNEHQSHKQNRRGLSSNPASVIREQDRGIAKESQKSMVRDNIRLYDGSMDGTVPNSCTYFQCYSSAHNNHTARASNSSTQVGHPFHSRPSLITPSSSKQNGSKTFVSQTPGSTKSKLKGASTNTSAASPKSPRRPFSKNQTTLFRSSTQNAFGTQKQASGHTAKSISPQISPKTALSPRDNASLSPSHYLRPIRIYTAAKGEKLFSQSTRERDFFDEGIASSRIPAPVTVRPISLGQRKISDKIEAIYNAKSMKKEQEYIRVTSEEKRQGPSSIIREEMTNSKPAHSPPSRDVRRRISKVADMTQFFDGKQDDQLDQRKSYSQSKLPRARSSVLKTRIQKFGQPTSVHLDSAQFPISRPTATMRSTTVEAKTILVPKTFTAKEWRVCPQKHEVGQCQLNKGATAGRIRLFEGIKQTAEDPVRQGKISNLPKQTRDSSRPRKNAYANPSIGPSSPKNESGLSSKGVEDIVRDFQVIEDQIKVEKQKTVHGNLRGLPTFNSARDFVARTPAGFDGASINAGDMIVKEAECGLKEPKPMRLVEMKRMMWLCRENSGSPVDKERNRVLHSKRF